MNGKNSTKFCIHIIFDNIYTGIVKRHSFFKFATELQPLNSEFGQPWTAELAALDQLIFFYLLENYLKILACSKVSDRCPLGYLFHKTITSSPIE